MKAHSIREYSDEELKQLAVETRRKIFDLRVRKNTGEVTDQPLLVRATRRDLARMMTVMKERGLAKHG